ncbi:MAG: SDR family oxidoreductase [Sphingomonas sp.]|nr:MAG: SDR family oxidoreductase [Sphingomonas sp.]
MTYDQTETPVLQQTSAGEGRAIYPSLAGKRVLVTGGGSGIGAGLVEAFVAQGARVAFVDVADEPSQALLERLAVDAAHVPIYHRCDLTDIDQLKDVFGTLEQALGGIDIPAQAVVPAMKRAGGGTILNFGSISWHLALPDLVLYQTCKAAIEGLTRGLARDLGRDGIRVNTIVPGNVQTPRQEKWYTPEGEAEIVAAQCLDGRIQPIDVAALVLFLASDDARMCTGHDYFIDAGWR